MLEESRDKEPPFYVAVRFARLRDRSIGQNDEIDALMNIMNETEKMMKMSNEELINMVKKRQGRSPEFIQQITFEIVVNIQDNLSKFIDSKINRIQKLLDYFSLDNTITVSKERQKLQEFEALWDELKQDYERIKTDFMAQSAYNFSSKTYDDMQVFQELISKKALPLMSRLKELEDSIQKRYCR